MTTREPDTPNWQPYSIKRLVRMLQDHVFVNEAWDWDNSETGGPIIASVEDRIKKMFQVRRETRPADYDPVNDDEEALFRVSDIAILMIRYKELVRLEDKLVAAMGPPSVRVHKNKKTGEEWREPDGYGDA